MGCSVEALQASVLIFGRSVSVHAIRARCGGAWSFSSRPFFGSAHLLLREVHAGHLLQETTAALWMFSATFEFLRPWCELGRLHEVGAMMIRGDDSGRHERQGEASILHPSQAARRLTGLYTVSVSASVPVALCS